MDTVGNVGGAQAGAPVAPANAQSVDDATVAAAFDEAISRGAITVGSLLITDNIAEIQRQESG